MKVNVNTCGALECGDPAPLFIDAVPLKASEKAAPGRRTPMLRKYLR